MSGRERAAALLDQVPEYKMNFVIAFLEGATIPDDMASLDAKLEHSYQQFLGREGRPMDEVFDEIERKHA